MPSGTEYYASKLRSILSLDTPSILPLFAFTETCISAGGTTPWSPLQCRLFILLALGSSGREWLAVFLSAHRCFQGTAFPPSGFRGQAPPASPALFSSFFTCARSFDTHRPTLHPVAALPSSAPASFFSCTLLPPGGPCQKPKLLCENSLCPKPSHGLVPIILAPHSILLSSPMDSSLDPRAHTSAPSCQHIQPRYFVCLLYNPTILLFVSDTQAAKRSWGKSQNHADMCQYKFAVSNLSITKQSFYMPLISSVSPFPTETIQ